MKKLLTICALAFFTVNAIAQKTITVGSTKYKQYSAELGKRFFYPYGKEGDQYIKSYAKVEGDTLYITLESYKEKTGKLDYINIYKLPFKHQDLIFSEVKKWYGANNVFQINISGTGKTKFEYDFISAPDGKISTSFSAYSFNEINFNDEATAKAFRLKLNK